MFKIHAVQADFGDSFILEYGSKEKPRYVLVDGGPPEVYATSLEKSLKNIVKSGKLDLMLLSHVDNDHVVGLLDLLAAQEEDIANKRPPRFQSKLLWHNSFDRTLDPDRTLRAGLATVMTLASTSNTTLQNTGTAFLGIREGHKLTLLARRLKMVINKGFTDELILVDTAKAPVKLGPLKLTIVGPSKANLQALRTKWLDWIEEVQEKFLTDPKSLANADKSIPNLSSIVVLAECEGKKVLMTGDARGDHIVEGLVTSGLMEPGKTFEVDVLKVQHHASNRNTTKNFFNTVLAKKYLISADGTYDNPDLDTLQWIIETAHAKQRPVEIIVTNDTKATKSIVKKYKPAEYGYSLKVRSPTAHTVAVALA